MRITWLVGVQLHSTLLLPTRLERSAAGSLRLPAALLGGPAAERGVQHALSHERIV